MNKPLPRSSFGKKFGENWERIFRKKNVVVIEHTAVGSRKVEFTSIDEAKNWIVRQGDWGFIYEIKEDK